MSRRLFAELFGTFVLVFAGTGAIVFDSVNPGKIGHIGVALTFGLVVLVMAYAVGSVSGAHLNPAVTVGLWLARRVPGRRVAPFVLAQFAGALAASALLFAMYPHHATLGATLPHGPPWHAFVLEVWLTAVLVFVVLAVTVAEPSVRALGGVIVGAVIALEALFAGPISGASMNPARSLAPALVSGSTEHLWVYIAAPLLGAVVAVPTCVLIQQPGCCRDGACS
ncbi:Aquaporin Z 2 [Gemmata sp. SH-PL17]|uniref:MIP/aquaporin family protein n=1 Tax=Gemmata sp. SH-PL17 TaxID=1630693 RepID=UPI00078D29EC|nr:aquaporin [Gemmata sp. SH-PL17]AMV24309.1 Aquaporin Z 2 [Gemmata sp. SH-PL17]